MIATCPNNSEHKRFITTAHVMQDWKLMSAAALLNASRMRLKPHMVPKGKTLGPVQSVVLRRTYANDRFGKLRAEPPTLEDLDRWQVQVVRLRAKSNP